MGDGALILALGLLMSRRLLGSSHRWVFGFSLEKSEGPNMAWPVRFVAGPGVAPGPHKERRGVLVGTKSQLRLYSRPFAYVGFPISDLVAVSLSTMRSDPAVRLEFDDNEVWVVSLLAEDGGAAPRISAELAVEAIRTSRWRAEEQDPRRAPR